MAARPKTLPAGAAPVVIGTAMAWADGGLHVVSALCALLGSLLIQIGTNFANDYFDGSRGTDAADRLGPTRVTQAGLVSPKAMSLATALTFLLACVPGLYLVWRGGWPFIVIGLLSILCGILYTAGPYPLGYLGLGDLFVLIFFGPVAVV
jgi:1,4-dihydroxy-2-naphthoate octaprenyltransferase